MYQLNLNWQEFLPQHWQKRPLVIRGAFTNFIDPISPEELAGLAMEAELDSRIVARLADTWQVAQGPFESFDAWGDKDWSLLVQAVDHWFEPVNALVAPFRGLPNWRLDDLMISYSLPGGGVGPHLDQYDVFIIQGMGRRRWRVGERGQHRQHTPHPDLLQVDPFEPIIDVELNPGDMLYIPPGFPHDGYALEPALNYSVGFRAPTGRELLCSFADHLLDKELGGQRYADPELQPRAHPGQIQSSELAGLRQLMLAQLQDEAEFSHWLAGFLSQARHELDEQPVEPPFSPQEVKENLAELGLYRQGGVRCLYLDEAPQRLFILGETIEVPAAGAELARMLADDPAPSQAALLAACQDAALCQWLTDLVNRGWWYFPTQDDEE
ncbi:cupin domain-containing protein [Pseudaeromonas paramecii]|uniref:[50S ribosomal protein L16]-arginine 3-hydroxylase n=1 Tax=Pseudaeromonas paramecii TaxID=2138166 RepID=A0ABP8QI01_9GAMM